MYQGGVATRHRSANEAQRILRIRKLVGDGIHAAYSKTGWYAEFMHQ